MTGRGVKVNILRQSRRLYGCGPLKGAFSQPAMVQESAAAQTRAMRAQTAKNILPEMSNSDSHPGRAGGSPWAIEVGVQALAAVRPQVGLVRRLVVPGLIGIAGFHGRDDVNRPG